MARACPLLPLLLWLPRRGAFLPAGRACGPLLLLWAAGELLALLRRTLRMLRRLPRVLRRLLSGTGVLRLTPLLLLLVLLSPGVRGLLCGRWPRLLVLRLLVRVLLGLLVLGLLILGLLWVRRRGLLRVPLLLGLLRVALLVLGLLVRGLPGLGLLGLLVLGLLRLP